MPSSACETKPAAAISEPTVRVFRSVEELEAVRPVWTAWQRHPLSDFDFYKHTLQHAPGNIRPHVFVLYREGAAEAMLIGWTYDRVLSFKVGYWNVVKKRARVLSFPYGGLLGDVSEENCAVLLQEVVRNLRRGEADVAMLDHLRSDWAASRVAARTAGFLTRDYFPTSQPHWRMTIPGTVEEIYQRLSSKVRVETRRKQHKFMRDFPEQVRIRCFRELGELEEMFHDVESVAQQTYQRGLGVGFESSERMRQRLELEARRDWLRAYVLYLSEKPVAFWIGTLYQGTFHSNFMGYDQQYGKYSPGMFLLLNVFDGFCVDPGVTAVDWGLGDADYKQRFGDTKWDEQSLWIFAPTFRGLGLNAVRVPALLLDRGGRKVLGQSGLLSRIKRLWRNRLRADTSRQRSNARGVAA